MTQITRRQFLEDSLLAAAVAAAFPAADALATEKKGKTKAAPKKAGDLLQVAIVGAGGRGGDHISEYLANPNTEIAYIVEADEKIGQRRAEDIGKRQGKTPKFARDLRTALDDKSVHIVSTATPNHWHALCAIWSMQAGKDVYVEKPVSHNVSEGRRIAQVARKLDRICQAGTQCRSMKGTIDAINYVKSGKIGDVKLARGLCYKGRDSIGPKGQYKVPPQVDYNLWAGPARMLPLTRKKFHYDWHWQREWGNGDMGNQGPHQMDIARWGLGLDRLADRVITYGGRLGYEDAGDVANTEVALCEFGDKTLVFEVRGLRTDPLRGASVGVIFYGSEGYVVLTKYDAGAAFDPQGKLVKEFRGGGDHFGNFVDAVKAHNPKHLRAEILEGHLSCAHSHLANISYYLGKPASIEEIKHALADWKTREDVNETLERTLQHLAANHVDVNKTPLALGPMLTIDSGQEMILGNAAAAAMLTRDYRTPFIVPKAEEV
ncbi:MAG: Gfo/Idh/MocA family protein [Thermoguttaceae bacterium]